MGSENYIDLKEVFSSFTSFYFEFPSLFFLRRANAGGLYLVELGVCVNRLNSIRTERMVLWYNTTSLRWYSMFDVCCVVLAY